VSEASNNSNDVFKKNRRVIDIDTVLHIKFIGGIYALFGNVGLIDWRIKAVCIVEIAEVDAIGPKQEILLRVFCGEDFLRQHIMSP
jgi:hypothetical protein